MFCGWTRLRFAAAALGLVLAAAISGSPAGAQSIGARGGEHEDFGRLVLDFTQPTSNQVVGEGSHLEVRLGRPTAVDLGGAVAALRSYVRSARLSADRRRIDIEFVGPVTWNAFNDGTKLALDFALADDGSQRQFDHGPDPAGQKLAVAGAPKPATAAEAAKAQPLPKVRLRTGEHAGYARLAFDWPRDVPYKLSRSGNEVVIAFAAPAAIDLDGVAGDLPTGLEGIGTEPSANGVTVRLRLQPGAVLRDFRSGHTVAFDIAPGEAPSAVASASPSAAGALQPVPAEVAPATTPAAEAGAFAGELQLAMPEPALTPSPNAAIAGEGASGPGVAVPVAAAPPSTFEPPRSPPPSVPVQVSALKTQDGAVLYFDWPRPVGVAVFRRGNALWVAFDRPGKADLRALKRLESVIGKLEPVDSPYSLAFRLLDGKAASVGTATEGARWKIALQAGNSAVPPHPVQQKRETLPNGATSLYLTSASGAPVELTDPAGGDLVVTPQQLAGIGVARESDWPSFKLVPSYQGIVVELLNKATKVQASPNGVVITTPPGGATAVEVAKEQAPPAPQPAAAAEASPASPAATPTPQPASPAPANPPATETAESTDGAAPAASQATPAAKPMTVVSGLFDLDKWRRGGAANFMADLAELKARVESAAPGDRDRARLDLAEFYLANNYAPEAEAQVDIIRKDDRGADADPLIMALGAAARTMAGEYDAASTMLAAPALQGVPEANLMRGVVAAARGRTEDAANLFSGPLPDIKPYPKSFRTRIRVLAAKALLDYGDPLTAQNFLDPLASDAPDADAAARAGYLDGLRLAKLGQKDAARQAWEKLVDSPIDEIKARTRFALVSQQLDEKTIEPKAAAEQLEALRYLWRGDTFEFDLLYKLGKLYFDAGQPRRSLLTLRQAATHFPDHPLAKQAADDMGTEFRKLYLEGGADRLSPLTAVALYDEFRELTPPGTDGDRMISALADRLVSVDLLDRAADLLERQVKTRLSGADKVKAGTRLAAVRLLDDKPDQALAALKESAGASGSPELDAERARLQARAMFDTGDTLKGLDLVRDDDSLEGLWLKADMFWKLKEWPSAADALGALIDAEAAKRAPAKPAAPADVAKNPASVLDQALAQAQAAAAADNPGAAPDSIAPAPAQPPAAPGQAADNAQPAVPPPTTPAKPQFDPVLSRLILNRAVALSLANDRKGLKEIGREYGKQMEQSALAEPFKVLTSPDTGLAESITAQMKSVDQLGVFVDEYNKLLKAQSLSGATEPAPDLGPTAPTSVPPPGATSGGGPSPNTAPQTAEQTPPQPSGQ